MGEVMKAAGLTHGAFYAHFGSKEELQVAAVAYGMKVSLGRMQHSNSKKSKASFDDLYLSRWHRDNRQDGTRVVRPFRGFRKAATQASRRS
ncbi:MAG: TetR/AcrR family transcriptional regulator [Chthoniobacterales bacterium]